MRQFDLIRTWRTTDELVLLARRLVSDQPHRLRGAALLREIVHVEAALLGFQSI